MTTTTLPERHDYMSNGCARTYLSTAGTQPAVPAAQLDELMARLQRDGFVVLERLFDEQQVSRMREDLLGRFCQTGRNSFEGARTQRLYAVIAKTRVCDGLVEHPLILGLLDRLLAPNYLLSQLQAINILPGECAQHLHYDDAFYPMARPRPAYGAATIMALDDFTGDNGATVVIPGSHLWDGRLPTAAEQAAVLPVVMPKGSVVFFLGTLWHGGGANRSGAPRLALTAQYCEPWARQQENFILSTPRHVARQCSEHIQRMLGYSIHAPFMGMVNGMHPKRMLDDPDAR
ncbi:phytanoyl-CoA dioxygenase family protein [Pseudomonas chlororaphis]|uniref:phytanoyl-CoA dioxygenase family protein n=1 Tax=Pseudomonas chlororaphis TaxID=587753 RepID=UPI0006A613AF|nr:phytanoyl-CoA dioxygenase family protein [Pseudomonas chlororaphis]AZD02499.1 MmcH [Pseudomonas chlororaphis subsp. chlororaphis]MBM0280546.1 phytanoyl-CoA dioxygenase family protein [Pseudomonas chlororaphis]MDO1504814.1 phytanoyl-CoA dioxygenase family protein [Pseudomonas chlororaphis]ORM44436.1 phytanoyl-CoA dioxygenase [Pseudomonas chlororaphis subsp. chlororaphis]TWR95942.1 phytanoyl-CoA dioxygenase family protein [Pseudomonas chlororaphis subsp. chlororaphis]